MKFVGKNDEINIKTEHPEFMEWKWENLENLPKIIVDFKKNLYEELIIKIKPFIN